MFTFQTASFSCYKHVIPQDLLYVCILLGLNEAQVIYVFKRGQYYHKQRGPRPTLEPD